MNTKLRCLLLDDELPGLTYLKMLCEQIPNLEVVKTYNSPVKLLNDLPELEFDLCILDIEMPEMNGLQVANLLNGKPVIFTTAYRDHAAEAFDMDAVDYVRKPIQMDRLKQAIDKAMIRMHKNATQKAFAQFNSDKGKAILFFEQMNYIKSSDIDSRDKIVVLKDGSHVLIKNCSFKQLLQQLPTTDFIQINKQEIIAKRVVQLFSFEEIVSTILSDTKQPIRFILGDAFRENFLIKMKS